MPFAKLSPPLLSLIVPVLDERSELPDFLANLATQREVEFELIICDGGSTDGSCRWLREYRFPAAELRVFQGPKGRARQLNQGLNQARGEWLLLLHVDSRFSDPLALKKALDQVTACGSVFVAGHFPLTFRRAPDSSPFAYYFYEWKARLGLPETIHGDQGFLLHRGLLERVGPFAATLPAMEDTELAERIRRFGQWQLLPAGISTSARRFDTEGLRQRQTLGALIMCFRAIEWDDFFAAAPDVYRRQSRTERLRLSPFFALIKSLLAQQTALQRWKIWYQSGGYVRDHAWQLFFALDARRAYKAARPVGAGATFFLDTFTPVFDLLTANPVGRGLTTLLLRGWFELTFARLRRREKD